MFLRASHQPPHAWVWVLLAGIHAAAESEVVEQSVPGVALGILANEV